MQISKIIVFSLILAMSQFTYGQSRASKIDSISRTIANKNPDIGISIGFIDHDKTHFFNYGKIGRTSEVDIDKETIFEIGSVTKVLTANLMAQAQKEDKIKITDFIEDHLPGEYNLPKNLKDKIQISDLASHQSGLPDFDFKKILELNPNNR